MILAAAAAEEVNPGKNYHLKFITLKRIKTKITQYTYQFILKIKTKINWAFMTDIISNGIDQFFLLRAENEGAEKFYRSFEGAELSNSSILRKNIEQFMN